MMERGKGKRGVLLSVRQATLLLAFCVKALCGNVLAEQASESGVGSIGGGEQEEAAGEKMLDLFDFREFDASLAALFPEDKLDLR